MGVDAKKIAAHTPFKESAIEEIRQHVFIKEHMQDGKMQRFSTDFDQAQAWQRLTEGRGRTDADLNFLKHEYVELTQIRLRGYHYNKAHSIANLHCNWGELID